MDPVSRKTALATNVVNQGMANVAKAGAGGTQREVRKQENAVAPKAVPTPRSTTDQFGVQTTTNADGSSTKKAQSGLAVDSAQDGSKTLSFTNGDSLKLDGEGVTINSGGGSDASLVQTDEGLQLIGFTDKSGNRVQVDPDSMTYEVLNKRGDTAQVFHPNGNQEVVAFGTQRGPDGAHKPYEKRALYDSQGALLENSGFENMQVKDGKLSFTLGEGTVTRSLPRALPGQPEPTPSNQPAATPKATENAAPTALLDQGSPMLALPAPEQKTMQALPSPEKTTEQAPAVHTSTMGSAAFASGAPAPGVEAPAVRSTEQPQAPGKAGPPQMFPELPAYKPGFFDGTSQSDSVQMAQTRSGVVVRTEGETRAFQLPNGDMFRTDGQQVEVLGDKPRAKHARMVVEDGKQLLAYSDKSRNTYQLDVNTGDLTVSNHNGSLKQSFKADGSQQFEARSTHTTDAGTKAHSFHKATFGADGTLVERSGFDNLEVGEKSLVYTLPNGEVSVKNLMEPTGVRYSEPKPAAPGVSDGWGDAQSAVDSILGSAAPAVAPASTGTPASPQTAANAPTEGMDQFSKPQFSRSGLTRTTLPDGSVMTRLPSGVSFTDKGGEAFATDPDGNRLEVIKREVPTESGYILYTKSKDGVGYTIAPDHLDMLVESKDGKVHQMVTEDGYIDTHIKDGDNLHVHQMDTNRMQQVASPGVRSDIRTPNRLYIDSPDNRSYELPHPLPTGPVSGGPGSWGQGVQPMPNGVQPMPNGTQPMPNGAQPVPNGTQPMPNGAQPMPNGGPQMPIGVKPSFWDRVKSVFTGENPWQNTAQGPGAPGAQGGPGVQGPGAQYGGYPPVGGYPGCQSQYDPVSGQMRQMERLNKTMMTMNMVSMGVNALSMLTFMPSMFYPFGGCYF